MEAKNGIIPRRSKIMKRQDHEPKMTSYAVKTMPRCLKTPGRAQKWRDEVKQKMVSRSRPKTTRKTLSYGKYVRSIAKIQIHKSKNQLIICRGWLQPKLEDLFWNQVIGI